MENRDITMRTAEALCAIAANFAVPFIFKASYRKANRTSLSGFTGLGTDEALAVLAEVRRTFGVPVVTDIHREDDAATAAEVKKGVIMKSLRAALLGSLQGPDLLATWLLLHRSGEDRARIQRSLEGHSP